MARLSTLRPGDQGQLVQLEGSGATRQRLLDMGFVPRASITLLRVAPAGDPVWVEVAGVQIGLRRAEANQVIVAAAGRAGASLG